MSLNDYRTPDALLSAYYASREEESPAAIAPAWLRAYARGNSRVDRSLLDEGDRLLTRSVFDVDDLAENFLGVHLYIENLRQFDRKAGAAVFGYAIPESATIKICERAAAYLPLYRSTVMHEVAHIILHRHSRNIALNYSPRSPKRPPAERDADKFMADALLPRPILYMAIVLAGQPYGVEPGEAFKSANSERGHYQWRTMYFPFFINRLCLSRGLVAVAMRRYGMFSEATFEYHHQYPIPNRWRQLPPSPPRTLELELEQVLADAENPPKKQNCGALR